jgi:hypothetical protein
MRFAVKSAFLVAVLALFLLITPSAFGAACGSNATGNWSAPATWTNCNGGIPTAADTVEIRNGNTVTVNIATAVAASMQIASATGTTDGSLVFNAGSKVTVTGISTIGGASDQADAFINMTNGGTFSSGGFALGTGDNNVGVIAGLGTAELTANNTLPGPFAFNNLVIVAGTTTFGGNFIVNGTLVQTGGNINTGGFTLTVNGSHDAGTRTVSGSNYVLAAGGTLLSGSPAGVNGNIITTARTLSTGANYTFDGTAAQVTGAAMPATVNNLTITNPAGVTLTQATVSNGVLNVASGNFNIGAMNYTAAGATSVGGTLNFTSATGTKTFTGNVTVNNGGTWTESANEDISFGGNLQNDGTINGGTGIHTFTGAIKTFGGANPIVMPNVAITGTYTNNGTLTVATALSGAGSLTQGANGTLNIGGTATINTLTATAAGNTVNYNGAAQTIKGANYYHLTLSGSGVKTLPNNLTTIAGNFALSGTATTTMASNLNVTGNLSVGAGTALTIGGFDFSIGGTTSVSGTLTHNNANGNKTFTGDVTINNGGIWNETVAEAISFGGDLQNDGNFTAGTGIHTFTGTNKTIGGSNEVAIPNLTISGTTTNTGTLTVSTALAGTSTLTNGANALLNYGGAAAITPTLVATAAGNTVDYERAGAQTVKATTYNNVTFSGSGLKTNTGTTVNGILSMQGTATASAAPTYGATATLEYKGSGAQVTGPELLATMAAGRTVRIDNVNGVTLNATTTINGTLNFTAGNLNTGANNVYIGAGGTVTRTSGHVVGNLRKYVATGATNVTFEVGDAASYAPAQIAFASVTTAGDVTVRAVTGDHANIGSSTIDAAQTANRNWIVTGTGIVFTNYSATFNFVAGDLDALATPGSFVVGRYAGGSWTYPTVGTKTGTSTQATGLTAFGDFQLGELTLILNISGIVFEDKNYGGGAGRSQASSSGIGRAGVRVELYTILGLYQTFTTTDAAGSYTFTGLLPGTYVVRVVNGTVTSSRGGSGLLAVQTYRTNVTSGTAVAVTDHVGGENPTLADAGNGVLLGLLATLTTGTTTPQSITSVAALSGNITGVDFGFSFNVIVNRNNTGQGSLRQFLTNANALTNGGMAQSGLVAGIDNAVFMLADGTARPGLNTSYATQFAGGVASIAPTSALPTVTDPVVLDASNQPNYAGVPIVELNGASAGAATSGFTITAGSSAVRGFVINRFTTYGINISTAGGNTVTGNYLGTNAAGTAASANTTAGIRITSTGNTVGGTSATARNVISGNGSMGINIEAGNNIVQGNYVGLNAAGSGTIANFASGISVGGSATGNMIGGTTAGAANLISGNGKGVVIVSGTGNGILTNSIYGNTGIGIDLNNDGVTANNGTKSGALPNSGMDTPVFTTRIYGSGTLTLAGYVGTAAGQVAFAGATVQVFKSDNDASGFGEGQIYLGTLTADANGNFSGTLTASLVVGDRITGTATDAANNTSEFGANAIVTNAPPSVALVKTVLPLGNQAPGADLTYTVAFTNNGGQAAQVFIIMDPVPANTDFKVGSVSTVLGTTGLTVAVAYSNNNGTTYTYTPVSAGGGAPAGYDRNVTNVRWIFGNNLPQTAPNNTGSVTFTVRIR